MVSSLKGLKATNFPTHIIYIYIVYILYILYILYIIYIYAPWKGVERYELSIAVRTTNTARQLCLAAMKP